MNSSEPSHTDARGADKSAALAASLVELGKIAAALSEQRAPATPPVSLPITAREIVDALLDRIFRPLPRQGNKSLGEVCPFTGLKRHALNELFQLRDEAGLPVIETVSMKEEGEEWGTKLFSPGSVLRHLRRRAQKQAKEEQNKKRNQ
jgi:hypothetical protein